MCVCACVCVFMCVYIVAEAGRVWVPNWGRIVKTDTENIQPGANVNIKYFCDATKRNWKRRLVLKINLP